MKKIAFGIALLAAVLVSGCGNGGGENGEAGAAGANSESADSGSSNNDRPTAAEIVAAESADVYFDPSLPRPGCLLPVNAGQYPTPDLVNVRIGMTIAEAIAASYCDGRRDFHVQAVNLRDRATGDEIPAQSVTMHNGDSYRSSSGATQRITLVTPGQSGQQRVVGVWRSEQYATEDRPMVTAVVESMTRKFGEPTVLSNSQSGVRMDWVFNSSGAVLAENDPAVRQCLSRVGSDNPGQSSWDNECGLTVRASVRRASENEQITQSYTIGMVNQRAAVAAFTALREAREAAQLERAQSAGGPDL